MERLFCPEGARLSAEGAVRAVVSHALPELQVVPGRPQSFQGSAKVSLRDGQSRPESF